jgi:hypothetical protein
VNWVHTTPGTAMGAGNKMNTETEKVSGTTTFDYLVDASGRAGLISTKYLKNRHVSIYPSFSTSNNPLSPHVHTKIKALIQIFFFYLQALQRKSQKCRRVGLLDRGGMLWEGDAARGESLV